MKTINLISLALHISLIFQQSCAEKIDKSVLKQKWIEYNQQQQQQPLIKRELQAKIIGGSDAPNGAYPWYAIPFIYDSTDGNFYVGGCGASLVGPDMLLTASHCVPVFVDSLVSDGGGDGGGGVIIGQLCLDEEDNCGQDIDVQYIDTIFPHPKYHQNELFGSLQYDLAVIKLEDKSSIEQYVPLDQEGSVSESYTEDKTLWVVGFGDTDKSSGVDTPFHLSHVDVQYVPLKQCNKIYDLVTIDKSMLCAGSPGKDSCQGDSGGPLYDKENDALVGIVSWGLGCADETHPGVYANIASEWSWIEETICNNHGKNNAPDFCNTHDETKGECRKGEIEFSLMIETNAIGNDCEWGIYNHEREELEVRQGDEYWSHSTYYSEMCIEEDVCHTLYLSGNYITDSSFEATVDDGVVSGNFKANTLNSLPVAGYNCTDQIGSDPFSGVEKIRQHSQIHFFWGLAGALLVYLL